MIHKQAGEGFASQNSEVLSIGVPADDKVTNLKIRWPSGIETEETQIEMSEIQTIRESK